MLGLPLAGQQDLRPLLERYAADLGALERRYDAGSSPVRRERFRAYYGETAREIEAADFDRLDIHGKVDWLLLRNELRYQQRVLHRREKRDAEIAELLPFRAAIVELHEARAAARVDRASGSCGGGGRAECQFG